MNEEGDYRRWDELIPDALGLIFTNLSLQEILTVVSRVCKSWNRAVSGPYCWQEINADEWSCRSQPEKLDRMLRLLVTRSSGSLRKLNVSCLYSESFFSFLAEHSGSLQTLRIPRSEISDPIMEKFSARLSTVTFLDVSYCCKIGAPALEAIGRNCRFLWGLCRNMHPLDSACRITQDEEAYAIATTMPKLKHLEMAYHVISSDSVLTILAGCPNLEFIDLRGCWHVKMEDNFVRDRFPKVKILGPLVVGFYEQDEWDEDDDDDCSEFSDYLSWEFAGDLADFDDDDDDIFDDEQRLQLRFYEPFEDAGMLYGWPPSP